MNFLFSLLVFFSLNSAWAKSENTVFSDQAVFKVEEKVYLLSDISQISPMIKKFRCLLPSSLVLKALELDDDRQKDLNIFDKKIVLSEERLYLNKILKLLKLELFVQRQGLEIAPSSLTNLKFESCGVISTNISSEIKNLLLLEGFWNDRFTPESFKLSEIDVEDLKRKNAQNDKNALSKLIESEKIKRSYESVQTFLKTIDKQITHDLFF